MRAEMKLATGMIPVAMGVAMALLSGMVSAEDKALQMQAGAVVSAETTLPSVGHRSEGRILKIKTSEYNSFNVNTDWLWVVGDSIRYLSSSKGIDPDNAFGANEIMNVFLSCKKYRVAPNGHEELLGEFADCENNDGGTLHKATEADIGYRFKFVSWWGTRPSSTPGYTASPSNTSEYAFISPPVSDLFHFNKVTIVTNNQNISAADNQRRITTTVKDVNNNPVRGLTITYRMSDTAAAATATPSVDNGDGSYTSYVTSNGTVSFKPYVVVNGINTAGFVQFYAN